MALSLQELKDRLAREAHGMTKAEAHTTGVCIKCKQPPILRSPIEVAEYRISGVCGPCFDVITADEDDA